MTPRRGRPPMDPDQLRCQRVEVRLTAPELAALDALRGRVSRSHFLLEAFRRYEAFHAAMTLLRGAPSGMALSQPGTGAPIGNLPCSSAVETQPPRSIPTTHTTRKPR